MFHSLCEYKSSVINRVHGLMKKDHLTDCKLVADGQLLNTHRLILSACSSYFEFLFAQQNEMYPIIFMKDIKFQTLEAVVHLMYTGKVQIPLEEKEEVLRTAESLQIKGLKESSKDMQVTNSFLKETILQDEHFLEDSNINNINNGMKESIIIPKISTKIHELHHERFHVIKLKDGFDTEMFFQELRDINSSISSGINCNEQKLMLENDIASTSSHCLPRAVEMEMNDEWTADNSAYELKMKEDIEFLRHNYPTDCILVAEEVSVNVHSSVLATHSSIFKLLFSKLKDKGSIIYFKDIKSHFLMSIVDLLYRGKVHIPENEQDDFFSFAESLKLSIFKRYNDESVKKEMKSESYSNTILCHKSEKYHDDNSTSCADKNGGIGTFEKSFSTQSINESVSSNSNYFQSENQHHIGSDCGKKFSSASELKILNEDHSKPLPLACEKCNLKFSSLSDFNGHLCFSLGQTMCKQHVKSEKTDELVDPILGESVKCNFCKQIFTSQAYLTDHIKMHKEAFVCYACQRVFIQRADYIEHLRDYEHKGTEINNEIFVGACSPLTRKDKLCKLQTGNKLFKCHYCDAGFAQRVILKQHIQIHTSASNLECLKCHTSFSDKCSLIRHILFNSSRKPFRCNYCWAKFMLKDDRRIHTQIHHHNKK